MGWKSWAGIVESWVALKSLKELRRTFQGGAVWRHIPPGCVEALVPHIARQQQQVVRLRLGSAAPSGDQPSGEGVAQIAESNHGSCPVGLDATDNPVEMHANFLGRERDPASSDKEMFAERNDPPSRVLISFQRPHD